MSPYEPSVDDFDTGSGPQPILGHPEACVATCDSGCHHIYDCPSATDISLVNPDTDAENVRYDLQLEVDDGVGGIITYPPSVILEEAETVGYFYRTFGTTCAENTMATWWAIDTDIYFIDPVDPATESISIDVRAFPQQSDIVPYTDLSEPWRPVLSCPDAGTCNIPVNPTDRQIVAGGNLYDAIESTLGADATQWQWLQLRVRIWRSSVAIVSPRLYHTDVFFFCDEAS